MLTLEQKWLMFWLFIWIVVMGLVIHKQWDKKVPSVGLPLLFLLSLSIIHWFGGMIYVFPWYKSHIEEIAPTDVSVGFHQSVYGVIGFGLGSIILAPLALKILKPSWFYEFPRQPNLKLVKAYLVLGLVFIFVLSPILAKIPSFAALANLGIFYLIVGLCLACWKAWCMRNTLAIIFWLAIACCLPLITTLTMGFFGYGAAGTTVVLVFTFTFYRPRWRVIFIGLLVMFLGFSAFVNYLRDRNQIRATVWGEKNTQTRIEQLQQTATNFELFDPFNQKHLELIDLRMNQNALVGKAVRYISSGKIDYAGGETLEQAAIALVPRILWQGKPVTAGSGDIVSRYTGMKFAVGTSIGVGSVLELYLNFGSLGVILGFIVLGTVIRVIDITAGYQLINGNWVGFTSWFLPGLAMINPGGSFVEVTGSIATSLVLVYIINQVYLPRFSKRQGLVNKKDLASFI
ncbi:hypothetical protein [Calothrix sp. PCC 7507]|uniref:hypothetical protein n=1 Tax=Calothrix sp. PCC 7507 TaxID=99598 RepID=UPI00029F0DB6|nr:hypothetical protein [Calothrix sp. PCC 7507]AFY34222.1 hypothetical protein Cal7507_3834 [Calothrix sp. PCC 7507]